MQHDLFINPDRRARDVYPLIAVLQADVVESDTRIVAPLTPIGILPNPPTRVFPAVTHDSRDYLVVMRLIGFLPARRLGGSVGSIASYRDDITRALDFLFFGI